jgi:outer membrane protein
MKSLTSYCFAFLMLLVFSMRNGYAQEIISLQKALEISLANNLQIKQVQFQASLSEQDLRQAKMNLFPTVNSNISSDFRWGSYFDQLTGSLNTQSVNSLNGNISSSVMIFQGFQRVNQVLANKYLLLADQSSYEKAKNDLQLAVVTTYLESLTNQDLALASLEQLKLSTQQLEVEQINFDVGNRTIADLAQAKSQVALDESNVTFTQNAFDLSILNLKQLMEMDPSIEIVLEKPTLADPSNIESSYSAKEVFDYAVENFPEIEFAKYNSEFAKKNIDIAKGGFYPALSASAGLGSGYTSSFIDPQTNDIMAFREQLKANRSEFIGLSLSIPIFNNFRTRIGVKKAKISYQNALLGEQKAKNDLNKIINQAVLDLKAADKNYTSSRLVFESMKEAFNVIKQRYDVGIANAMELSTSQTNMNKAEFDFITAKYNMIFRSKVIDFYLGKSIKID